MQALAEGDLSERARQRAEDLGNDAALRAIAPKVSKQQAPAPLARRRTETAALSTRSDDRLPPAGSVIVRDYIRGEVIGTSLADDDHGGAGLIV
jgi:hypothetical protein